MAKTPPLGDSTRSAPETGGPVSFTTAVEADVEELAALHALAAADLTRLHGQGRWSLHEKFRAVLRGVSTAHTVCAQQSGLIVGTYRLTTKKPWVIDLAYFTPVQRVLYLQNMAVLPSMQGKGIGRALLAEARRYATERGFDAIRLDAYDSPAGAGGFYLKCGFGSRGGKVYRSVPVTYFEWLVS